MDNKTGKFILSLRTEKGLSQYQLAEMIPISRQAVSKWERGENIPDSFTLLKLSEIFNVSINELLIGERTTDNSIESLERTTLTILDQSNRKSREIKRMIRIFTSIITVLLLSFLSYYFITSYNSIKVYTITGDNVDFRIRNGMFLTTKEKYYIKLGNIENNTDEEIKDIKLCYEKNGKEIVITEDINLDDLYIVDYYGYSERIKGEDVTDLIKNTYIKITYGDNEEEVLNLRFKRDFINGSLFKNKKKNWGKKKKIEETIVEAMVEEEKEEPPQVQAREENVAPIISETIKEELVVQEITTEDIVEKIKEVGDEFGGTYTYVYSHDDKEIYIIYYENMNKITIYDGFEFIGDYITNQDRYNCAVSDCDNYFKGILKDALFN